MLSFERLQAFLRSNETQLNIDVPGENSAGVPAVLIKRRVGRHTYLLYCFFIDDAASGEWEILNGDEFHRILYYSLGSDAVFVPNSYSCNFPVTAHLSELLNTLREWYNGNNRLDEAHLTSVGRKLSAMYAEELHLHYSDAEVLKEVEPSEVFGANLLAAPSFLPDVKAAVMGDLDCIPNIVKTVMEFPHMPRTVFTTNNKPISAYEEFYFYADEDAYIAKVFDDVTAVLYDDGSIFVPQKDPIMETYAGFLKAKELWATHPLFAKYRDVAKAVEDTIGKNVIVTIKTPNKEYSTSFPTKDILRGINTVHGMIGADDLCDMEYSSSGGTDLHISLRYLKSIKFRGKVLYEDPLL